MTGRGLVGRRSARLILVVTLLLDGLVVALFLSQPSGIGPMFAPPPSGPSVGVVVSAVGVALHLVGLAWMVRIIRADPEEHASWWRVVRGR